MKMIIQFFVFILFYTIVPVYAQPILTISELNIRKEKQNEYNHFIHQDIIASYHFERGVHAVYVVSSNSNPNKVYLFNIYSEQGRYQDYIKSQSYKLYLQNLFKITNMHPRIKETKPIFLAEKPKALYITTATQLPVIRFAEIVVKPEVNLFFQKIVVPEMQKSMQKEKGVLAMYAVTGLCHNNHWYFIEIYADEAAYQFHRNTSHFKDYIQHTTNLIISKKLNELNNQILMNKGRLSFLTGNQ